MEGIITKRQNELLSFIYDSLKSNGFPPTFEEMKDKFGIKSNQAIADHLNALERKGLVSRDERSARSIKISPLGFESLAVKTLLPVVGTSYAGAFAPTYEISGLWQEVSSEVKINNNAFLLQISGDSMINAGIFDGDTLLAQNQNHFTSGDIVLAQTREGTTVKRFISQNKPPFLYLKPENPAFDNILFSPDVEMRAKIIGKLVSDGEIKTLIQGSFL